MRHLLLHPTHRKFIRLLRSRMRSGYPFLITQSDMDAFHSLSQGTMTMLERHYKIYRMVLNMVYRSIEDIDKNEKVGVITTGQINIIEKCFARAERKHLGATITSGYLIPLLQKFLINSKKKEYSVRGWPKSSS